MTMMPSAEAVTACLRDMGAVVPDGIPGHDQEIGEPALPGQVPMTLPPIPPRSYGDEPVT